MIKRLLILTCLIFILPVLPVSVEAQHYIYLPIIFKSTPTTQKGLLIPFAYHDYCQHDTELLGIDWYYINSTYNRTNCPDDARYVPRIFSGERATPTGIETAVQSAELSGWVLGFDEPNLSWGGNTTPTEGAILWRDIEAAAMPVGIKLVAPTPSQHAPCHFSCDDNRWGHQWLWRMVAKYERLYGERPHFDALGWNVFMRSPTEMQSFLLARRQEALALGYDLPFWINSYAGECWQTGTGQTGNGAIMEMTTWFRSTSWIDRYAWFTNRIRPDDSWASNHHSCTLVDPETGALTELGETYRGF